MTAAIEVPFAFFQKPVEVVRRDAIEPIQMPLRLVQEILNPIDVMSALGYEDLAVVNASVVKL